ncbi:site-specific integrase [Herbaspirillum autotrophicum]|uniref:site-specific integrase n=1 Tax=Herbaspirillum autotrophicum TaxID=180195 RepID=UPI000AE6BFAB|nr:site-specific integrase [Herbaspirillum autotrophicum]
MKSKITRELLRDTKTTEKTLDIMDTDVKGFLVRLTPSGAANFAIRYSGKSGRQERYSLGMNYPSTSVSEAREAARILLGRIAAGENPADDKKVRLAGKLTLFGFIDGDYGEHLRSKSKSAEATIARLKKCFATFKDQGLAEVDTLSITRWRANRIKAGKAASTVNRDIGALRPVFSRAVDWKLLAESPMKSIKALKSNADPIVRFLSSDEEKRLRAALDMRETREREGRARANIWRSARHYELLPHLTEAQYLDYLKPAVLLSINTGVRQGEMLKLRIADVNLENDPYIFIRGATAKSNKGRHVPLNDEAQAVLSQWIKQHPSEGALKGLVFPGKGGKPLVEIKTAWRNLLRNAEITGFRWHDMRHHFASRLVMAGVDLNTVRELLGHSDLKMTLRYAHLAPEHKAAAVQKLMRVI